MKKWMRIVLWILFTAAVVTVFVFAIQAENARELKAPKISIHVEGENAFLTENELLDRLKIRHLFTDKQAVNALRIRYVEHAIESMAEVKHVKVFKEIGSDWHIELELRKPIARIFNTSGQSYYLDQDGFMMNRSRLHTARVLVFSGSISDRYSPQSIYHFINNDSLKSSRKIDQIYRISNYVCNDPLLHKMIGQAYLEKDGDFILIPLIGDQQITFGSARSDREVRDKFDRLLKFYKEAMPHEGWDKYSEISVKYEGQIVCRKRKGA
ncbi:MAG: hypothetical protein RLZZ301_1700 [Bacteroidota bacterium]|jgi:cell division protein FtsQ